MLSRQWLMLLFIPWIHHRSRSDLGAGIPSQKASVSLSVKWNVADPTAGCGEDQGGLSGYLVQRNPRGETPSWRLRGLCANE